MPRAGISFIYLFTDLQSSFFKLTLLDSSLGAGERIFRFLDTIQQALNIIVDPGEIDLPVRATFLYVFLVLKTTESTYSHVRP